MKSVNVLSMLAFSFSAFAAIPDTSVLDITAQRGSKVIQFKTPQNRNEICVLPQHSPLGNYSDKDSKAEKELCSYDFHGLTKSEDTKEMALCPKFYSSNPGVLIMDIPEGWDKKKFEATMCFKKGDLNKNQAKFKQTVTCSYTPSLLSYYHFSRYLDGAGRVPVAVLRTMLKERHSDIVTLGVAGTAQVGGAIHGGWRTLRSRHLQPLSEAATFDSTGQFVYGALQDKLRNEAVYNEINGGGPYDGRYKKFVELNSYQMLTNPKSVLEILNSKEFQKIAQPISMLKDQTDMILLDTLLTQNDRMFNLHYKWAWTWIEKGEVKSKFAKGDMDKNNKFIFETEEDLEDKSKYEAKGAVLIKQMVLKDNDCGVRAGRYGNKMKMVKALDGIRHISGKTYTALMKLAKAIRDPAMGSYLKNETLMNDADLKLIRTNVFEAGATLKAKCKSGELKLDLDLETYFSARPETFTCDI